MKKESGQVILILILVMTVALSIGLSVVQKSLVDVSTASKVEQSSRAHSAAEAGIEKALVPASACGVDCINFSQNSSKADVVNSGLIPSVPSPGSRQAALEYPPLAKEDVVQVWLADPSASLPTCAPPNTCYSQSALDVYWGNSPTDKAALELTIVYFDGTKYASLKRYLDHPLPRGNGFDNSSLCTGGYPLTGYQCYKQLTGLPARLILLRARLLYNSASQKFAVQAVGTCGAACSLPSQARSIIATGSSGETQRKVSVFQLKNVVPAYFDYAIFAAGEIRK